MDNPRKQELKHDYSGYYSPAGSSCGDSYVYTPVTFSVGIFRWIPKVSGKGLEKSTVLYRVKGYTSNPEPVYKRAGEICEELDEAFPDILIWMICKKSETVK